jgi:hypothetical protein
VFQVLPFYGFAWKLHEVVARAVRKHQLPVNPNHLTNNLLHSVDHYNMGLVFHAEANPLGDDSTLLTHVRASILYDYWNPVETAWNPVENEYATPPPPHTHTHTHTRTHSPFVWLSNGDTM